MGGATGSEAPPQRTRYRSVRGQILVLLGVVLTFAGLVLVALTLPTNSTELVRLLPIAAAGVVALWLGGLILGRGGRPKGR